MRQIKTLEELRAAKRELKIKMARQDAEAKEGFLYSTVTKFFDKVESNTYTQKTPVGSGVNYALNFLSDQAQSKFKLSNTTKSILSVAIMMAAPIIAKKVQDFMDDKF